MPKCKNIPEGHSPVYYSGNENTPRGKGWCAKHEPEGKVRVGKDGKKYCVKGNRWVAHGKSHSKKSPSKKSPSKRKTSPRLDLSKYTNCNDLSIDQLKALIKTKEQTIEWYRKIVLKAKDYRNGNQNFRFGAEDVKKLKKIRPERLKRIYYKIVDDYNSRGADAHNSFDSLIGASRGGY